MKKILILFPVLLVSRVMAQEPFWTVSDNGLTNRIDSAVQFAVQKYMESSSRFAISVGVYTDGKVYTYNYADKIKCELPNARTLYEIGPISSTFTGLLLAQAITERKLRLNDELRRYPSYALPNLQFGGQYIRLKHLIGHTSGLPFKLPEPDLSLYPKDSIPDLIIRSFQGYTKSSFLRDVKQCRLDTTPGLRFQYSNAGLQLLGYMLESINGLSFEQLLRRNILLPQKMLRTTASIPEGVENISEGHDHNGQKAPYQPIQWRAACGMLSCTEDLLRYIHLHLNEKIPAVVISHRPVSGDFGNFAVAMGWQVDSTSAGIRRLWQGGRTFGFSSYCVIYPDQRIGIVLLANQADDTSQQALETAAEAIYVKISEE